MFPEGTLHVCYILPTTENSFRFAVKHLRLGLSFQRLLFQFNDYSALQNNHMPWPCIPCMCTCMYTGLYSLYERVSENMASWNMLANPLLMIIFTQASPILHCICNCIACWLLVISLISENELLVAVSIYLQNNRPTVYTIRTHESNY